MRIAFISVGDTTRKTGGYLYHQELFRRLRAQNVEIDEIVASGAALDEQLAAANAFVARFDPEPYDATVVDALARAVVAPGVAHWQAVRPLLALVHELPSIASAGDADEPAREAPLLAADRLVAVSDDGEQILVERGVPPARIVVASGGFDRVRTNAVSAPEQVVLCVAQWIARKGILELTKAWHTAAQPGWRLELVGETDADPAYAELVRAAIAEQASAAITVRGVVDDATLAAAYGRAALFAMPSHYEGYGIAFAEALASGLPVLGCAVGPVPALVGDAGILVPPGDGDALAAALTQLLGDASLRIRLRTAARRRAAQLPTWDDCAARFLAAVKATLR